MTWSTAFGYFAFVASVAFWFFLGIAFGRRIREHEQSMAALEQKWAKEDAEWAEQRAEWVREDAERMRANTEKLKRLEALARGASLCSWCGSANPDGACDGSATGKVWDCPYRDQEPEDAEWS